ncbi:deoxyribose-phosphate aldolase [Fundicoccus culcitae]|uniref:Deoxyribose-phosphate aldolase n=1 Tax=Fundicoccus culcitae TaxID=2969821 RepID=A0ABY5P6G5_9LACT|nr:deoxyribose-phosphate aldolase [Fundicoccus culcitae]UUX34329.1 deoxyribose-phosphate aldolase [Fundicoccus culcitae]
MRLAKYIDHTLLKADATPEMIEKLCQEAIEYDFMSVCVNPVWVKLASKLLDGTEVKVCTVIGFPLGASTTATKVFETKQALLDGANEVDMVMNIGAAKAGDWEVVKEDIHQVVKATVRPAILKVILETSYLTADEIVQASLMAKEAGADYVKTSTGFSSEGATVENVKLMRETVGNEMGVKASGGVSNYEEAMAMIEAGASRLGASKGIQIVDHIDSLDESSY